MSLMAASDLELRNEMLIRDKIASLKKKMQRNLDLIHSHKEVIPILIARREKRIQDIELKNDKLRLELHDLEFPRKLEKLVGENNEK